MPERREDSTSSKLYQVLATAIEITGAHKGNIQFFDEQENALKIVAQIGFNEEFLKTFETVHAGDHCCGQALAKRKRVIIEDTSKERSFDPLGSMYQRFGFSACQSTPLIDEEENFFGVLSTHFKYPHRPSDYQLYVLDAYLAQAAPTIARKLKNRQGN